MKKVDNDILKKDLEKLKVGEEIYFSGIVYTARDRAHKKLVELIKKNKRLPFDINGSIIYYCGATINPKDKIIGSCGPTTSRRMDSFVEPLLKRGLLAMIGKGSRSDKVKNLIKKYKALYLIAPSGCGALLAKKVISKEIVAFEEFGTEAIYKLIVKDFPLVIGIDARGRSIY
ncbi:MAG: FumA C-terminus/TtdB family hydratase beta subunit [Candidatus Aenigmatarchaeota archaeon]